MNILADIGGTFVRFAVLNGGTPDRIQKYKAEDFESFDKALHHYCAEHDLQASGALRIATAGYEDGGVWKFVNRNKWVIDQAGLEQSGWKVETILNDFEAGVWALINLSSEDYKVLKEAPGGSANKCLLGPGTGLGLGYLHAGDKPFVQKTHGGHMPVSTLTDEQGLVVQAVQRLKADDSISVFENFVSGPGLYNIYAAQCLISGTIRRVDKPEAMLNQTEDPQVREALRLFHEFFGLFAATAVVTGHAYGGLYLTGGVLERLVEHGLFDFEQFEEYFCVEGVSSVKRDLEATPVYHVTYPYPALKGLLNA